MRITPARVTDAPTSTLVAVVMRTITPRIATTATRGPASASAAATASASPASTTSSVTGVPSAGGNSAVAPQPTAAASSRQTNARTLGAALERRDGTGRRSVVGKGIPAVVAHPAGIPVRTPHKYSTFARTPTRQRAREWTERLLGSLAVLPRQLREQQLRVHRAEQLAQRLGARRDDPRGAVGVDL